MKIVIDVPDDTFEILNRKKNLTIDELIILNSTPLPKGHGRLIDADELESRMKIGYCIVRDAPTIIEADKAESEG